MGHADLDTTAVYLGLAPKHLEEAIQLLDAKQTKPDDTGLTPGSKGGPVIHHKESLTVQVAPQKGRYLSFNLAANSILIDSIVFRPYDSDCVFEVMLLDREQADPHPAQEDIVYQEKSYGQRITWVPQGPFPYNDRDKSKRLHWALMVRGRPYRVDIDEKELGEYLALPVSFEVTLSYHLPTG